jgi:hypothetical protein
MQMEEVASIGEHAGYRVVQCLFSVSLTLSFSFFSVPSAAAEHVGFFFRPRVVSDVPIRVETFGDKKKISEVTLSLSPAALSYSLKNIVSGTVGPTRSIPVTTFLAATVKADSMVISYYPLDMKKLVRRRCTLEFGLTSPEHAVSWTKSVQSVLFGLEDGSIPRRHILVLVNPFGGTKKAPQLWTTIVRPMWDEAGITYDVVETK